MRSILLALALLAVSGCLYRQPIYQGNLLESKNVEQLQAGMSKRQVLTLLGSPSVSDPFQHSRWDYISTQKRGHRKPEIKRFTVFFDGEAVSKWDGDYFPEQDLQLATEVRKFGPNLARDKDKDRRRQ